VWTLQADLHESTFPDSIGDGSPGSLEQAAVATTVMKIPTTRAASR
jgi:hypothetical protein